MMPQITSAGARRKYSGTAGVSPAEQIPLTCNEIAALFSTLIS